jgi:hypothetical protein
MKYQYNGPPSGVTLGDTKEVLLHPGKAVELDPEHPYTRTLLAQGRLAPVPVEPASEPAKGKKDAKGAAE